MQGMSNSNRSVSQYYLMAGTDDDNYEEVLVSGRKRRKVRFALSNKHRNLRWNSSPGCVVRYQLAGI